MGDDTKRKEPAVVMGEFPDPYQCPHGEWNIHHGWKSWDDGHQRPPHCRECGGLIGEDE